MATTDGRVKYPLPRDQQDPWYDEFKQFADAVDASTYAEWEDRNIVLTGGGEFTWDSGTGVLTWDALIEIASAPVGLNWVISANAGLVVADGEFIYFQAVRAPTTNVTVGILTGSQVPATAGENAQNSVLVGVRRGTRIYFRNGRTINNGDTIELFQITAGGGGGGGGVSIDLDAGHQPVVLDGTAASSPADAGSSTTKAASFDHRHPLDMAPEPSIQPTGVANAAGSLDNVPRGDHGHRLEVQWQQDGVNVGSGRPIANVVTPGIVTEDIPNDRVNITPGSGILKIYDFVVDLSQPSDPSIQRYDDLLPAVTAASLLEGYKRIFIEDGGIFSVPPGGSFNFTNMELIGSNVEGSLTVLQFRPDTQTWTAPPMKIRNLRISTFGTGALYTAGPTDDYRIELENAEIVGGAGNYVFDISGGDLTLTLRDNSSLSGTGSLKWDATSVLTLNVYGHSDISAFSPTGGTATSKITVNISDGSGMRDWPFGSFDLEVNRLDARQPVTVDRFDSPISARMNMRYEVESVNAGTPIEIILPDPGTGTPSPGNAGEVIEIVDQDGTFDTFPIEVTYSDAINGVTTLVLNRKYQCITFVPADALTNNREWRIQSEYPPLGVSGLQFHTIVVDSGATPSASVVNLFKDAYDIALANDGITTIQQNNSEVATPFAYDLTKVLLRGTPGTILDFTGSTWTGIPNRIQSIALFFTDSTPLYAPTGVVNVGLFIEETGIFSSAAGGTIFDMSGTDPTSSLGIVGNFFGGGSRLWDMGANAELTLEVFGASSLDPTFPFTAPNTIETAYIITVADGATVEPALGEAVIVDNLDEMAEWVPPGPADFDARLNTIHQVVTSGAGPALVATLPSNASVSEVNPHGARMTFHDLSGTGGEGTGRGIVLDATLVGGIDGNNTYSMPYEGQTVTLIPAAAGSSGYAVESDSIPPAGTIYVVASPTKSNEVSLFHKAVERANAVEGVTDISISQDEIVNSSPGYDLSRIRIVPDKRTTEATFPFKATVPTLTFPLGATWDSPPLYTGVNIVKTGTTLLYRPVGVVSAFMEIDNCTIDGGPSGLLLDLTLGTSGGMTIHGHNAVLQGNFWDVGAAGAEFFLTLQGLQSYLNPAAFPNDQTKYWILLADAAGINVLTVPPSLTRLVRTDSWQSVEVDFGGATATPNLLAHVDTSGFYADNFLPEADTLGTSGMTILAVDSQARANENPFTFDTAVAETVYGDLDKYVFNKDGDGGWFIPADPYNSGDQGYCLFTSYPRFEGEFVINTDPDPLVVKNAFGSVGDARGVIDGYGGIRTLRWATSGAVTPTYDWTNYILAGLPGVTLVFNGSSHWTDPPSAVEDITLQCNGSLIADLATVTFPRIERSVLDSTGGSTAPFNHPNSGVALIRFKDTELIGDSVNGLVTLDDPAAILVVILEGTCTVGPNVFRQISGGGVQVFNDGAAIISDQLLMPAGSFVINQGSFNGAATVSPTLNSPASYESFASAVYGHTGWGVVYYNNPATVDVPLNMATATIQGNNGDAITWDVGSSWTQPPDFMKGAEHIFKTTVSTNLNTWQRRLVARNSGFTMDPAVTLSAFVDPAGKVTLSFDTCTFTGNATDPLFSVGVGSTLRLHLYGSCIIAPTAFGGGGDIELLVYDLDAVGAIPAQTHIGGGTLTVIYPGSSTMQFGSGDIDVTASEVRLLTPGYDPGLAELVGGKPRRWTVPQACFLIGYSIQQTNAGATGGANPILYNVRVNGTFITGGTISLSPGDTTVTEVLFDQSVGQIRLSKGDYVEVDAGKTTAITDGNQEVFAFVNYVTE